MLIKQEFNTKFGLVTLIRDGDLCTVRVLSHISKDFESTLPKGRAYDITLTVDEYSELIEILKNSPFIFSKNNV